MTQFYLKIRVCHITGNDIRRLENIVLKCGQTYRTLLGLKLKGIKAPHLTFIINKYKGLFVNVHKFDPMLLPVPIRWGTYFPLYSRTIKHSLICRTTWYNNWKCAKISKNKLRKNLWFYCNFNLRFSEVM